MAGVAGAGKRAIAAVVVVAGVAHPRIITGVLIRIETTGSRDYVATLTKTGALIVFILFPGAGITEECLV